MAWITAAAAFHFRNSMLTIPFYRQELLKLYNALNDTAYEDLNELEVYTLENAIYMSVKNDVSFLMDSVLNLYEQQASVNPNMPLRDLIYIARQMEKYIRDRSIYSSKLVRISVPKFVVFYNGTQRQADDKVLKLSDAFMRKTEEPELELKVRMLNINLGHNRELLEKCKTLGDYSVYVNRVREHTKSMPVEAAVRLAVDECIEEGVLADFLLKQKAEVIAMSIFEYNEEVEMKKIRADEYSLGWDDGMEAGMKKGRESGIKAGMEQGMERGSEMKLVALICKKLKKGKTPEVIAEELEEDLSVVLAVVEAAAAYAPDFDVEAVYKEIVSRREKAAL